MKRELPPSPTFWVMVGTLLDAARKRASGRRRRQQELMHQRRSSNDWGIGFLVTLLVAMIISGIAAFFLDQAAKAGEHAEAERQGKIVVSLDFFNAAESSRFAYEACGWLARSAHGAVLHQ